MQETQVRSLGQEEEKETEMGIFLLGEGNGHPLQYSCLERSMDRGAWWTVVHGVTKSQTRLSDYTFTFTCLISEIVSLK